MTLTEYRRKRNFKKTAEPRGKRDRTANSHRFVIQKHAATNLHYDFRLELDGVLKSWAVPKGPSLNPATKRLAIQVEDHPLEYGNFEGIIPAGEYGGGTVMLWDQGNWEPQGDPREGFNNGSLKFTLHGEKLRGGWMLVRKGGKRAAPDERTWFLFKEQDRYAAPKTDVTAKQPLSVTTGRDLAEISSAANKVWSSQERKQSQAKSNSRRSSKSNKSDTTPSPGKSNSSGSQVDLSQLLKHSGAKRRSLPSELSVQLATLVKSPPAGDKWLHEIKFDGYRMLCQITDGKASFISRNGHSWTKKFPQLVAECEQLPVESAAIDGEVVMTLPDGTTSFQALQNAFESRETPPLEYYCFDLLYLDGHDLRPLPIETRKELLRALIPSQASSSLKYSEHVTGHGETFFAEASRLGLEGIISKRAGRPYRSGRGKDWVKVKASLREEFVIGGFTAPGGSRRHFGALALGYYDDQQRLHYAGRVGTGFTDRTLSDLHKRLAKLVRKTSPFVDLSGDTGAARDVTWVTPELVAQVEFSNWTQDRQLRHPSFQGLREDKPAGDVRRDEPVSSTVVQSTETAQAMAKQSKPAVGKQPTIKIKPRSSHDAAAELAGVKLSSPDKVLYPEQGITKLDLAHYYEQVAEWLLPHAENRLLSLVRCPQGNQTKCFYQKHPSEGSFDHLRIFQVQEKTKTEPYVALYDFAGLVSLVQIGVLEIHVWGSRTDKIDRPDRLIFDLDPDPAVAWEDVVTAAREIRHLLADLDLNCFLKTTGGKGLHVVVPIQRRSSWNEAKEFSRAVAETLEAAEPEKYISKMSKAARRGKIFIDYLRNDRGATSITPYSTRARPGAPLSVPITWEELSPRLKSDQFNVQNLPARLQRLKKDPWAEIGSTNQSLSAARLKKLRQR